MVHEDDPRHYALGKLGDVFDADLLAFFEAVLAKMGLAGEGEE